MRSLMTKTAVIGMLLAYLTALSGCSKPQLQPKIHTIRITPPAALLVQREIPRWQGGTNSELVAYIMVLRETLDKLNMDKKTLQRWSKEITEQ